MEELLHDRLDTVLDTYPGHPLLLRYVDNLTFVCKTERDGHEILEPRETSSPKWVYPSRARMVSYMISETRISTPECWGSLPNGRKGISVSNPGIWF